MSSPSPHAVPADTDTLLGYENALRGHANELAVFAAPDLDTFNALDVSGVPAICPRDGEWLKCHADLAAGWEIVFAFMSRDQRLAAASVFDGYARDLFVLSDEKLGHSDLVSYLVANDNDADRLNDLAMRAQRYDYHEEQSARAAIIPLGRSTQATG